MGRGNRRKRRGSVIAESVRSALQARGRGGAGEVIAKLQLLGGAIPGFEDLQWTDKDMLSRLALNKRAAYVEEVLALAIILGIDIWHLAGLSPHPDLPPEIQALRSQIFK